MYNDMFLITNIVTILLYVSSFVSCGCPVGICEWLPWKAWSSCSATCGGGSRSRSRSLCCEPEHLNNGIATDKCLQHCGKQSKDFYDNGYCSQICYNGGVYLSNSCSCTDEYYGTCCSYAGAHRIPPFLTTQNAKDFLHHISKRDLSEECREGCDYEEVDESLPSYEVCGYMKQYKCRGMSCGPYCSCKTIHEDCSHIKHYIVGCGVMSVTVAHCSKLEVTCHTKRCLSCDDGFFVDGNDCTVCPGIEYCKSVLCNSATDKWCTECNDPDLYKLDNNGKKCAHKCSWENRWCWPGACGDDYSKNCVCDAGFKAVKNINTANCQLDAAVHKPDIMECLVKVFAASGEARPERGGGSKCSEQRDFYGNFPVDHVTAKGTFEFKVDIKRQKPAWVVNYMFELTDASMDMIKKSVQNTETPIKPTILKHDPQSQKPENLLTKEMNVTSPAVLRNGESLCFRFSAKAGGHLVSNNVQTHAKREVPYDKIVASREVCYIYDTFSPVHCSVEKTCTEEPLVLSARIVRELSLKAYFIGWLDPIPIGGDIKQASQIETYEITVLEVTGLKDDAPLKVGTSGVGTPITVSSNVTEIQINLPTINHPVLYAIQLEVKDVASNTRRARRFVLYDNSSSIALDNNIPLLVTSAYSKTGHTWQINHGKLCYSWKNRFYNTKYKTNNLLRPIIPALDGEIKGIYEQNTGVLPVNGTENVHGITKFIFSLSKNTITLQSNQSVPYFKSQVLCVSPNVSDGDTFLMNLKSIDIMNNTFEDNVSVHIDASVAEINNIWLVRDGYKRLFVHNSIDLSKMILQFQTFDPHSGIYTVEWGIGTTGGGLELGHGALGVIRLGQNESCPSSANCYCPSVGLCEYSNYTVKLNSLVHNNTHIGNHNRQYFFVIKVTNSAQLVSTQHIDILVDDSPPASGVVQEGPEDGPDIDFTSDNKVIAHWHGFIDHESGIKLYRVGLARNCLTRNDLENRNQNESVMLIKEITETSVVLPLNHTGKQYVTVMAYNNAMEPSKPICSDGIVFDQTSPVVGNISLTNAKVAETVACSNGTAWFIHDKVTRIQLNDTESCRQRCSGRLIDSFILALPEEITSDRDGDISSFMCDRLEQYNETLIYIPTDTIELHWDIDDEFSQIGDIHIGFGTNKASKDLPDIVGYQKSKHKLWFRDRHPALSSGTKMYIFIKAVNKAGLETIVSFGPVLIDETPPICPPTITAKANGTNILLEWNKNTFYDLEQREQIGSIMFRIGHTYGHVTPFLQWKINESPTCLDTNRECIHYPLQRIQKSDTELGLMFYFDLHVYNYAGHYCSVKSDLFSLPSQYPPGHGVVIDVEPNLLANDGIYSDIDFTFKPYTFCASWTGFRHHQNVSFQIGVGHTNDKDDVLAFDSVTSNYFFCGNSTKLIPFQRYFVTVRATCSGGITSATSDGFMIIDSKSLLNAVEVFDGPGCPDETKVGEVFINSTIDKDENVDFAIKQFLHVGKPYSFGIQPCNINVTLQSQDWLISNNSLNRLSNKTTGLVIKSKPMFRLQNSGKRTFVEKINIYACENDIEFQSSTDSVHIHWSIDRKYEKYISHSNIGIFKCPKNTSVKCSSLKSVNVGKKKYGSLHNLNLSPGYYKTFVEVCFDDTCLEAVESDGFTVYNEVPISGTIKASIDVTPGDCNVFNVEWEDFTCSMTDNRLVPMFYTWAIFSNATENTALTPWTEVIPSEDGINKDKSCLKVPSYLHNEVYVHVQVFCKSGSSTNYSVPVIVSEDPNMFSKHRLYDVDASADFIRSIEASLYSTNIGAALKTLHKNELDFSRSNVVLGGIIFGTQERSISWYLMKRPEVPVGYCYVDKDCVITFETNNGFAIFKKVNFESEKLYYICAESNETIVDRELFSESFEQISLCSDGVFIDDTEPSPGAVKIVSNHEYITDSSEIVIQWDNFEESDAYITIGYTSGIRNYMYSLGSYPSGQDVVPFTNAGQSEAVIRRALSLQAGNTYYASVKAFNHIGMAETSISAGVLFDNTPPEIGILQVGGILLSTYVVASDEIYVHWMDFKDKESGIADFEVGIGSTAHSANIIQLQSISGDFTVFRQKDAFHDGYRYFAIIKVTNRAGLFSFGSSEPFITDSTPPFPGVVRDGPAQSESDLDYQRDTITLSCHWTDFTDPHSHLLYYRVGLGSEPGETDIVPFYNVALRKEITWKSHFEPGQRYYVTVEACNRAKLCTTASSNGIIMDNSPPIAGLVHVGVTGKHVKYVSHSTSLQAQWIGFQDPESEIHHFEACIGTVPELCDIEPFKNFLLSSSLTLVQLNMPVGKMLYVTIRAYNHVGFHVDKSSDGFMIDVTPPINKHTPRFIVNGTNVSHINDTQWDVSLLNLEWEFEDKESAIVRQTVSLLTHHDGHSALESVELTSEKHLTLNLDPKHWLRNGDKYHAKVTSCNAASLCTSVLSKEILIDSSPPHLGGFKLPLTWKSGTHFSVYLKWYGFIDIESNIKQYGISVGKTYSGSELSGGMISFSHVGNKDADQEGEIILIEPISVGQKIFLSIMAVNNAGLVSPIGKIATMVVATDVTKHNGKLLIEKHSCDAEYCNKDCTCAVIGTKCSDVIFNGTCTETDKTVPSIAVIMGMQNHSQTASASSACLSANWFPNVRDNSTTILRYEWSFGVDKMPVGTGIFDNMERKWYDVGLQTHIVHCLPSGRKLQHDDHYVAYVRVWISKTDYITFTSLPVKIDLTPPAVRKGRFIKDSDRTCAKDVDYTNITDTITACWNGVFSDQQTRIVTYHAYLGTAPGADDIKPLQNVGLQTSITWDNLSLQQGTKYYITIQCTNEVNLQITQSSDGFIVDTRTPYAGVVFNTERHKNRHIQSSNSTFQISWHGFEDSESHIQSYKVAVLSENYTILHKDGEFKNVGIVNSVQLTGLDLTHGKRYIAAVKAVDAAGYESKVAFSDSILIDVTAPTTFTCNLYNRTISTLLNSKDQPVKTWKDTIFFKRNTAYRLNLKITKVNMAAIAIFTAEQYSVSLPFSVNEDGSLETEYNFISPYEGEIHVMISVHGVDVKSLVHIEMSTCVEMVTETSDISAAVMVRQISPNSISVCVNVIDEESGIRHVLIGAGTTPGGFQIKSLAPSALNNHIVMDVNVMHKTPIFVTVIVENNAGIRSSYSSEKILIDHTPPIITDFSSDLSYNLTTENVTGILTVSWKSNDFESAVKICFCALGSSRDSTNMQSWTEATKQGHFQSQPLLLHHGEKLYAMIKCVNNVELATTVHVMPITVAIRAPDVSSALINIISETHNCQSTNKVQSNDTTIQLIWSGINDLADITSYQCRIRHETQMELEWTDVSLHTGLSASHLNLMDGYDYIAEVRASNNGGISSPTINGSVMIRVQGPAITGNTITMKMLSENAVSLEWENVFIIDDSSFLHFTLTVGTKPGYCDIVRYETISDKQYLLEIDPDTSKIFVTLTATYCTGKESTVRQILHLK